MADNDLVIPPQPLPPSRPVDRVKERESQQRRRTPQVRRRKKDDKEPPPDDGLPHIDEYA